MTAIFMSFSRNGKRSRKRKTEITGKYNRMLKNLAKLDQTEMDKVNVDLAAAGVAFKERYNMPVIAEAVEREQPEHLRSWFRERLIAHRLASVNLSRLPYEPKLK